MKVIIFVLLLSSIFVFAQEKKEIEIFYISNIEGKYIDNEHSYFDIYSKLKELKELKVKHKNAIFLNTGANFWPNKNIEFMTSQKDYLNKVAKMLNESNFNAISIGKRDFYAPYELMQKISSNENIKNLPFLGSNITCIKNITPICKLISNNFIIIKKNGIKIALLSMQNKDILSKSYYRNVEAIKLEDENYIDKLAQKLKKEKNVEIVILIAQMDSKSSQPNDTMKIFDKLSNVDLIISNNTKIDFLKTNKNKYILGSQKNPYSINYVNLTKENKEFEIKKNFIKVENTQYEKLQKYKVRYDKKFNISVKNTNIKNLDFKTFYKYFLRLLVDTSDSELAIVNKELFSDRVFPIKKLTYSELDNIINYNETLVSFSMKGENLKKFLTTNKDKLLFSNVEFGKTIKINSKEIINKRYYEIATIDFLAKGGDGYFIDSYKIDKVKYYSRINEILINDLEKNEKSININKFRNLSADFIWEFYSNLGLFYNKNSTDNSPFYDKTNLNKSSQEAFRGNLLLKLFGISRYNILDNQLNVNYDKTKLDKEFEESNDLISYKFNYKSNFFKYNYNFFMVPLPYIEFKLNSEFTKSSKTDNHYFETFISTGASFMTLKNKLEFKLGFLASKDFSYDKNEFKYNIVFGYFLDNYKIELRDTNILFSSKLEYIQELGAKNSSTIDFYISNNIPLWGILYFNLRFDVYFYKDKGNDWANYYNMLTGINIIFNRWM